jgi:prepilin-type N-terminal cleavage/methylation domain-containing protein
MPLSFILHPSAFILPPSSFCLRRRGFTLMELLIAMMILTLLAGITLSALAGATEAAREQRTRAIIAKIDSLIMERYEGYRTRAVPVRVPPGTNPRAAAQLRLNALRELMRLEMPDRISDICIAQEYSQNEMSDGKLDTISTPIRVETYYLKSPPSLALSYKRRARTAMYADNPNQPKPWTYQNQGSECLFLILSSMQDGDKSALDYFSPSEIGDTDDDGQEEILDAWGRPILFVRWAPGYIRQNGAVTNQSSDSVEAPDPFDPAKADPRWQDANTQSNPFALTPLIVSAGRDREFDLNIERSFVYQIQNASGYRNDPYVDFSTTAPGQPFDFDNDGDNSIDNITNHFVQTP